MQTIGSGIFGVGDCFDLMAKLPDASVDMVLADLPYGTTACKWDSVLPYDRLWSEYLRVTKPDAAIVLTASMPFTAALVMSNPKMFRYSLVWDKVNKYTGALNANRMPLRRHEDILVFYRKPTTYNKQYREGKPYNSIKNTGHGEHTQYGVGAERRILSTMANTILVQLFRLKPTGNQNLDFTQHKRW